MNNTRIVFMGTPAFALGTLDALVHSGIEVAAVVTAPERPAGRGRQARPSAVKQRALDLGIPLYQPDKLKDPQFLDALDRLSASMYVVVAFRMLPEVLWSRPPLGTINLHASLLPDYRGAAPINWAVINGERRTGLTTFMIRHAIDTGDILMQEELTIGPDETAGELHDRMMRSGAELMVQTIKGLVEGSIKSHPQMVTGNLHDAPKIGPENCRLHLDRPAQRVHDLVRGMSPAPGAWGIWKEIGKAAQHFKVLRTRMTNERADQPPGNVRIQEGRLFLACEDEWIEALEVQPEGKRRMGSGDLVRGLRVIEGIRIE